MRCAIDYCCIGFAEDCDLIVFDPEAGYPEMENITEGFITRHT